MNTHSYTITHQRNITNSQEILIFFKKDLINDHSTKFGSITEPYLEYTNFTGKIYHGT